MATTPFGRFKRDCPPLTQGRRPGQDRDASAATSANLEEVMADDAMSKLLGERLVRVFFFHAGVLPSRDPGGWHSR